MGIYGGVEAGGTKFVCAVGSGPDDLQDEVRFETTSPKETINRTLEYFKKQNLKEKLPAIGIGSFGPIELNREFSNYGFGFQKRMRFALFTKLSQTFNYPNYFNA